MDNNLFKAYGCVFKIEGLNVYLISHASIFPFFCAILQSNLYSYYVILLTILYKFPYPVHKF